MQSGGRASDEAGWGWSFLCFSFVLWISLWSSLNLSFPPLCKGRGQPLYPRFLWWFNDKAATPRNPPRLEH